MFRHLGWLELIFQILRVIRSLAADPACIINKSGTMEDKDQIWFDGVDKKLIEVHSKNKPLAEGNDRSLVTKEPLTSFSTFSKKRKQELRNARIKKLDKSANVEKTNGSSTTKTITKDSIRPNSGITDELALDCEMVECYHHKSVLARVSIVNLFGHPILDKYVAPPAKVTDYRTKYSGIRKRDIEDAPDFETVQAEVAHIIKDKVIVGHALHNDFSALKISHPPEKTRDTSRYFKYLFQGKTPSLKKLCESVLGISIQKGEHDSVQDAQATMRLYVTVRDKWNSNIIKSAKNSVKIKHTKKQKHKPAKKKIKVFYVEK